MLTLDPIFTSALQNSTGVPIVKLFRKNPVSGDFEEVTQPIKYKMERLSLTVWFNEPYPHIIFLIGESRVSFLRRGLTIGGTDYTVDSPYWYPYSYTYDDATRIARVNFLAWDTAYYNKSTSANNNPPSVIGALLSDYQTASFLAQEWTQYQFDKAGSTLKSISFEGILPLLWNRYTVKMFPRKDGVIWFKSKILGNEEEQKNIAYVINNFKRNFQDKFYLNLFGAPPTLQNFWAQIWNPFWEDETGATHRLSATYPSLSSYPVRNVGFLPSTADPAYIKRLLSDNTRLPDSNPMANRSENYILHFYPSIEQGDFLSFSESPGLASVIEQFNMPDTIYPWQTNISSEGMYYGIHSI